MASLSPRQANSSIFSVASISAVFALIGSTTMRVAMRWSEGLGTEGVGSAGDTGGVGLVGFVGGAGVPGVSGTTGVDSGVGRGISSLQLVAKPSARSIEKRSIFSVIRK